MKELSYLPLKYKGNIKYFDDTVDNIKKKNPIFTNFIDKYFIKVKRKYFVSKDFDYYHIPNDIRANSYVETYNKFIKENLGKKRIVNWYNFIIFLKNESKRIKDKIYTFDKQNININKKKQNFDILNIKLIMIIMKLLKMIIIRLIG